MERLTAPADLPSPREWLERAGDRYRGFWLGPADPRVYDIVRIGIALACLATLTDIWPVRQEMFSERGSMDLEVWRQATAGTLRWSLFRLWASPLAVDWIIGTGIVASALLVLGLFSRVAAIVLWVVIVSYSYRCTFAMNGWDVLIRVWVGLLCISPLGVSLGVDAWRRRRRGRERPASVPRYGLVLMQIQLAILYWQTFWLKVVDEHWRSGELLSYFMLSMYSIFPDPIMADLQVHSAVLSYLTLLIELALPILLWVRSTRWLGIVLGLGLHGTIALATGMSIWIFSLAILSCYPAYLDGRDLDATQRAGRWLVDLWYGTAQGAPEGAPEP